MRKQNERTTKNLAPIILIAVMTFSNFANASLSDRIKGLFTPKAKKELSAETVQNNLSEFNSYYKQSKLKQQIEKDDEKISNDQNKLESPSYGIDLSKEYLELFPEKNYFKDLVKEADEFIMLLNHGKDNPPELKKYLNMVEDYLTKHSRMNEYEINDYIKKLDQALFFEGDQVKEAKILELIGQHKAKRALFEKHEKDFAISYSITSLYNDLTKFADKNHLKSMSNPTPSSCNLSYGFQMKQTCLLLYNIDYSIRNTKSIDPEVFKTLEKYKILFSIAAKNFEEKEKEDHLSTRIKQNKIDINIMSKLPASNLGNIIPISSDFEQPYQYMLKRFQDDPTLINKSFDEIYLSLQRNYYPYRKDPKRKELLLGAVIPHFRPHNSSELATKDLKFIELFLKECIKKEKVDVKVCQDIFDSNNEKYYGAKPLNQQKNKLGMILEKYYAKKQIKKDKDLYLARYNYLIERLKGLNKRECSETKVKKEEIIISSPLVKPAVAPVVVQEEPVVVKPTPEEEAKFQEIMEKKSAEMKEQLAKRMQLYYLQAQKNLEQKQIEEKRSAEMKEQLAKRRQYYYDQAKLNLEQKQ